MPGSKLVLAALFCVVIALGLGTRSASGQTLSPQTWAGTLEVFLDGLADHRRAHHECRPEKVAEGEAEAWAQARAVIVATLWANGFPADFVESAEARLDAPGREPDCSSEILRDWLDLVPEEDGWTVVATEALDSVRLRVIGNPPPPERWAAVQAAFAEELPAKSRAMACLAALEPLDLPHIAGPWNAYLVEIGQSLVTAGYPRAAVVAEIEAAEANALLQAALSGDRDALRLSCEEDQDWYDWLEDDRDRLADRLDAILKAE